MDILLHNKDHREHFGNEYTCWILARNSRLDILHGNIYKSYYHHRKFCLIEKKNKLNYDQIKVKSEN